MAANLRSVPRVKNGAPQNPLIDQDNPGDTIDRVRNVLEFLAWHDLEGEDTEEIQHGRHLILQTCIEALKHAEADK